MFTENSQGRGVLRFGRAGGDLSSWGHPYIGADVHMPGYIKQHLCKGSSPGLLPCKGNRHADTHRCMDAHNTHACMHKYTHATGGYTDTCRHTRNTPPTRPDTHPTNRCTDIQTHEIHVHGPTNVPTDTYTQTYTYTPRRTQITPRETHMCTPRTHKHRPTPAVNTHTETHSDTHT